ncbi:MAG: hypothetical protein KDD92_06610 [Caldilineaceae bacterium]|nr:hypothetical protein [Caldilineaceae bacterium]
MSNQTRWIVRGRGLLALCLTLFVGMLALSSSTARASDPPTQPFDLIYSATGVKYRMFQDGTGMLGRTEGALENVSLQGTSIVRAYVLWAGLGRDNNGILVSRDAESPVRVTAPSEMTWNNDTFGESTWGCCGRELSVYAADITDLGIVTTGIHNYTVSDMVITHQQAGEPKEENWGYSLIVIYEDPTLPRTRDIFVKFGNDGLFANWDSIRGPNSDVQCIAYEASDVTRTATFRAIVGGVETERRPNALWGLSGSNGYVDTAAEDGTWTENAGLIHLPPNIVGIDETGGIQLDGPFADDAYFDDVADDGSPFYDRAGDEWDEYARFNVDIPAGNNWTCLQVESATQENRPTLPDPTGEGNDWVPASIGFMGFTAFVEATDAPEIQIVKYTNGADANDPNGAGVPVIAAGDTVTWTYEVTNIGTVDIPEADITVTDNVEGTVTDIIDKGDGDAVLAVGEVWWYQLVGTAVNLIEPPDDAGLVLVSDVCTQANAGNDPGTAYTNIGTVTIPSMSDEDPSSYCNPQADPLIDIVKYTNGFDANDPDGADVPIIIAGDTVTWTYEVTNIGTVDIPEADITVTDNVEGTVTDIIDKGDGDDVLAVGEVWWYQLVGTAINLDAPPADTGLVLVDNVCTLDGTQGPADTAYTNVGTVTIPTMSADDPSSYCNPPDEDVTEPEIQIIKYTNGADANDPDGSGVPIIAAGDTVTWTYEVTNIGTVDIPEADITVTDNVEGTVTDIIDKGDGDGVLAVGEVWLYQLIGTAVNLISPPSDPDLVLVNDVCTQGGASTPALTAYTNVGTVTIPNMSDEDPSSYCPPRPTAIEEPGAPGGPGEVMQIFIPVVR